MKYDPDELEITPEETRKIADLREELQLWGHDVSNLSDIEIKAGVLNLSHVVTNLGVTAKQAVSTMTKAFAEENQDDE